ncbi:MAG: GNAT family N-acetyltransferase [Calditrichia bacterium]
MSANTSRKIRIRTAHAEDAAAICGIYNHYIRETAITFEVDSVTEEVMLKRINSILEAGFPWLVAVEDNRIIAGYAYAQPWKTRRAYRYSLESTIYLHPGSTGRGTGSRLYGELLSWIRGAGYHTVIGGIALPNPASIALHEKFGFGKVAHFREVGYKFERWIDVGYWQLHISG